VAGDDHHSPCARFYFQTYKALIAVRYILFAGIATAANLGTQRGVLAFGSGWMIFAAALLIGTAAGLIVKYELDRRWIFQREAAPRQRDGREFILYGATAIITTLLFWAIEAGFYYYFRTQWGRELGGVLGLSLGYAIKYQLDRHFVFRS
jgi:putative flippase GtrA